MTTLQTALTTSATVTTSSTLAAGKHTPVDATSGALTMTLPTPARAGARLRVEKVDATANAVTITGTIRGTSNSVTLAWQYESVELVAESTTSWRPSAGHKTKASLDAAYVGKGALARSVRDYGAVGDARAVTVTVSAGSTTLTGAGFTSADNGKTIAIAGAGASGTTLLTTVTYVSATALTLANAATTAVTNASAALGTDDTNAFKAAIAATYSAQNIFIPKPLGPIGFNYLITSPLQISHPGINFVGASKTGVVLWYAGTGSMFVNGTDNGQPYDGNYYDGLQYLRFEHLTAQGFPGGAPLTNGVLSYAAATTFLTDWRGGDIQLKDIQVGGFETGLWCIQSDFNSLDDVTFLGNKLGAYIGPRSDQARFNGACYFLYNDRAIDLDSCWGAVFNGASFVDNGSATVNPVRIRSQYTRAAKDIVFNDCWFEHLLGPALIESFVEVGVGDTIQGLGIIFNNTLIYTGNSASAHHTKYFVKTGNTSELHFDQIRGLGVEAYGLIDSLIYHVDTAVIPRISARIVRENIPGQTMVTLGSGAVAPAMLTEHLGGSTYGIGDGSGNRPQFAFLPNGNFPQLTWQSTNGTQIWVQQVGLNNSQLLMISKLAGGELHIQDHSGNDHLKFGDNATLASAYITLGSAGGKVGFYGAPGTIKPTITGSRGGNVALGNLLTALAAQGILTDGTTT